MTASPARRFRFRHEAVAGDSGPLRGILSSTGVFFPFEIDVAIELLEDRLEYGDDSPYSFIFCELDNRLIGYICFGPICMTDNRFDLYWIAVDKGLQGTGIGKLLLEKAEQSAREAGGVFMYVETSGRDDYLKTRHFYENQGYLEVACIRDFYRDGDDKIILAKKLTRG
ncbi:MAG TPA: GNAT family N-acetyltransferase [Syntrophales bacterium]|nr:GNAT family N-acetyltransferase [Syntrophales bacterium]